MVSLPNSHLVACLIPKACGSYLGHFSGGIPYKQAPKSAKDPLTRTSSRASPLGFFPLVGSVP